VELAQWCKECADDPLRFVLQAYPWGEPGPLLDHTGPDTWQRLFLQRLGDQIRINNFQGQQAVAPIRCAVSSGHGIGKSVMVAWLVNWIMSTRPNCQGTVTANTFTQLETKTWAAVQRWTKLCLTSHWFTVVSNRMYRTTEKESWFCAPQSCREENSEAFAGQHAADSTSFYINDEDSAVPDKIHEVEEGGLTDGEPMQFLFGNATRLSGAFYQACFGSRRDRYLVTIVDSRESRFTNKAQIAEWIQDYGEDSDFVRVRVKGLPPAASDLQYIDSARVFAAQTRVPVVLPDEPLVCGLDVARGGGDECVFRFRRGADARSIAPIRVPGEQARDSMRLVSLATEVLTRQYGGSRVHTLFIDGSGIGGPICDRVRQLGHFNAVEVQFGGASPDPKLANMRAYMWSRMKEWLARGAIDSFSGLEIDLTGPGYHHNPHDQVVIESKEKMKQRGVDSPDDADALALTFAQKVVQQDPPMPKPIPASAWN
jgi:hypothetical protein